MNDTEVISWILLATAFASEKEPTNVEEISHIADGINHDIPTHEEIQTSLNWLINKSLVQKTAKKYQLTSDGIQILKNAKSRTNTIILNIWAELAKEIEDLKKSTDPS